MTVGKPAPACHLSWTVTKVSTGLYAVAATSNGLDYDFVGNFMTLTEAHRAGRMYSRQLIQRSHYSAHASAQCA